MDPSTYQLFSVGHSNHDLNDFLELLTENGIEIIVDVRTFPSSQYSPQFNRNFLQKQLRNSGIRYEFLGDSLGGRPDGDAYYDDEGYVLYDQMKESEIFLTGMDQLLDLAKNSRVAMMCSEGVPSDCHRHLLVSRVLAERNPQVQVKHLLPKGGVISSIKLLEDQTPQPTLFGTEELSWKSTQSVSRNIQH